MNRNPENEEKRAGTDEPGGARSRPGGLREGVGRLLDATIWIRPAMPCFVQAVLMLSAPVVLICALVSVRRGRAGATLP